MDPTNQFLFGQMMREYLQWHEANNRFYDGYEADKKYMKLRTYLTKIYGLAGIAFAAVIINPNFTSKSSFYLRKINCLLVGYTFYAWGIKRENQQQERMWYRMNDYFPLEVKRALQDKDYRHLALFDWENPGRQLFDERTGKSLS